MIYRMGNKGETIVEVLLSAALLSLAITVSFGIARTSLDLGTEARERTQATKIAETQVELLKFMANQPGNSAGQGIFTVHPPGYKFCLDVDAVAYAAAPGNVGIETIDLRCGGRLADGFPESDVEVSIDYSLEGPDPANQFDNNTFTVSVSWDEVRSGDRDQVVIAYRLHPII